MSVYDSLISSIKFNRPYGVRSIDVETDWNYDQDRCSIEIVYNYYSDDYRETEEIERSIERYKQKVYRMVEEANKEDDENYYRILSIESHNEDDDYRD